MIDMNKRRVFREFGTGDMATLADENPRPAFGLGQDFLLLSFIAQASGGSGGTDQHLEIYEKIATRPDGAFDIKRRRLRDFGTGSNPFYDWRLDQGDERHWIQSSGDLWVPVWMNPDPGNMTWKLRVELVPWE